MNTPREGQLALVDSYAQEVMSYRLPGSVTFGLPGGPQQAALPEHAAKQFKSVLKQFLKLEVGFGVEVKSARIETLFDFGGHGACNIDMMIGLKPHAKSGLEPWEFRTICGYRRTEAGEEGFESTYLDGEVAALMRNIGPKFFEGIEM